MKLPAVTRIHHKNSLCIQTLGNIWQVYYTQKYFCSWWNHIRISDKPLYLHSLSLNSDRYFKYNNDCEGTTKRWECVNDYCSGNTRITVIGTLWIWNIWGKPSCQLPVFPEIIWMCLIFTGIPLLQKNLNTTLPMTLLLHKNKHKRTHLTVA